MFKKREILTFIQLACVASSIFTLSCYADECDLDPICKGIRQGYSAACESPLSSSLSSQKTSQYCQATLLVLDDKSCLSLADNKELLNYCMGFSAAEKLKSCDSLDATSHLTAKNVCLSALNKAKLSIPADCSDRSKNPLLSGDESEEWVDGVCQAFVTYRNVTNRSASTVIQCSDVIRIPLDISPTLAIRMIAQSIISMMLEGNHGRIILPSHSQASTPFKVTLAESGDFPGKVTANGIMVTGDETYPLKSVQSNLKLTPTELADMRDNNKKVLSIAEGMSTFLPSLLDGGIKAQALDLWYNQSKYPAIPMGEKMAAFSTKYKGHLVAGSALDMPFGPASYDVLLSHQLLNNLPKEDGQRLLDESVRVLTPGGEARIFSSITSDDADEYASYLIAKYKDLITVTIEPRAAPALDDSFEYTTNGFLITIKKKSPSTL